MAEGVMEMKEQLSPEDYTAVDSRVQYFLDRFYMSRIGLRMLIHQHCMFQPPCQLPPFSTINFLHFMLFVISTILTLPVYQMHVTSDYQTNMCVCVCNKNIALGRYIVVAHYGPCRMSI